MIAVKSKIPFIKLLTRLYTARKENIKFIFPANAVTENFLIKITAIMTINDGIAAIKIFFVINQIKKKKATARRRMPIYVAVGDVPIFEDNVFI